MAELQYWNPNAGAGPSTLTLSVVVHLPGAISWPPQVPVKEVGKRGSSQESHMTIITTMMAAID